MSDQRICRSCVSDQRISCGMCAGPVSLSLSVRLSVQSGQASIAGGAARLSARPAVSLLSGGVYLQTDGVYLQSGLSISSSA